jgi:hypothetical protein
MPFEHIIDHSNSLVVVRGSGEGSAHEVADSLHYLLENQSISTDYTFMFVVDGVTRHPTPDEMLSIVFALEMMLSRFTGCIAIVASQVGFITAANLIAYKADKKGGRIRVFSSESQAREWLLQMTH